MKTKIFFLMPIAFVCEFIDSSLGMGYGPLVMAGAILSVPIITHTIKRTSENQIKFAVAAVVLL